MADITNNSEFMKQYNKRLVPENLLDMDDQIVIYNDTVVTYHWQDEQKVGVEITNQAHAQMMRQMFEHYWRLADNV